MATTGIWKIEKRLDRVIKYITNADKTKVIENTDFYKELHNISEYNDVDANNEEGCYVSAINCNSDNAYKDMMFTKEEYDKKTGILGYHAFQSFNEGEVTADQAHLIGLKLAQELWGDKYEVIVATHNNTNHIHNHFVINSVSFIDGKKYHDCRESYAILRETSDSICEEFGLTTLKDKNYRKGKVNYDNYYKKYTEHNNYYQTAKRDIDTAIKLAHSYHEFEIILTKLGYDYKNRYGKLSVHKAPYKRNIRIERAFGSDYSIDAIEMRIELQDKTNIFVPTSRFLYVRNRCYQRAKKCKSQGIYGLYKYYCYLLNVYPKHYPSRILPPSIRVEVNKMNDISAETRLLVSHKISTIEQFLFYKETQVNNLRELVGKRQNLWMRYKRSNEDSEKGDILKELENISSEIKKVRKEVVLCKKIEEHYEKIKEDIREFDETLKERKEKEKNEFE